MGAEAASDPRGVPGRAVLPAARRRARDQHLPRPHVARELVALLLAQRLGGTLDLLRDQRLPDHDALPAGRGPRRVDVAEGLLRPPRLPNPAALLRRLR